MAPQAPAPPDRPSTPEADRLDSWKEIAAHLSRGVTTVQRWELEEGLPIHRLPHRKKGSVFAFKGELDEWRLARVKTGSPRDDRPESLIDIGAPQTDHGTAATTKVSPLFLGLGLGLVGIVAAGLALPEHDRSTAGAGSTLPARPLANNGGESSPSLSPDGTEVVYNVATGPTHGIYIKSVMAGTPRQLNVGIGITLRRSTRPKWSPRGDQIAFLVEEASQQYALFVIAPNGGPARRLTSMAGIGHCWHPDGSQLGFVDRNSAGEPFSVFSLSIDTGERRRLTTPPPSAFGDTYCAFSPSGRQLAIIRHAARSSSDVHVVDLAAPGAPARRLTIDRPGMQGLAWTPDGRAIIAGATGLWRLPVEGSPAEPTLIGAVEGFAADPSFSSPRQGTTIRLAYEYLLRDVDIWRWTSEPDGAHTSAAVPGSIMWEDYPAVSPDGRKLAYVSNRSGDIAIWCAAADGADARQLTFHGPISTTPQWSPDSTRLAFASAVNGNWDLYVIDATGARSKRLTWEPSHEDTPSWSRDGRSIYFRSDRSGRSHIWRMPVDGGPPQQITAGEGSQAFESPDGTTLFFIRSDDAPGLWSMPVAGGPETLMSEEVWQHKWAMVDDGILFAAHGPEGRQVRRYDMRTKTVSTVVTLPGPGADLLSGFSATPDGKSAFWVQTESRHSSLMIIDGWK